MKELDELLGLVIQDAWAKSTRATRNSRYIRFCNSNNLVPVPASTLTVARFLVDLASTCVFSTCNNYLSSVVSLHKFMSYGQSFRDCYVIRLVLKGLTRRLGKEVNQQIGLSPTDLGSMYSVLDFSVVNKWFTS